MKYLVYPVLFLFLMISLKLQTEFKTIDFESFKITVPENWNKVQIKGIDNYVGGLVTDQKDTLIFDIGWYSADVMKEDFPLIYDNKQYNELSENERKLLNDENYLIVDSISQKVDVEKYRRQKFVFQKLIVFKRN